MPNLYPDAIFIRHLGRYVKIPFTEICYIESKGNYARVVTTKGCYLTIVTLKRLEEMLPETHFCRVQRGYIVALSWIRAFDKNYVYGTDEMLPIGDTYAGVLEHRVRIIGDTEDTTAFQPSKRTLCRPETVLC